MSDLLWLIIFKIYAVHHGRKSGHWGMRQLVTLCLQSGSRERKRGKCWGSAHFLLVQEPIPWNDATQIQNGSSYFNLPNIDTALQIFPYVCLLRNAGSCHIDNINHCNDCGKYNIPKKKKKKRPTRFKEVILLSMLMKISEVNEYLQGALSSPQKHYCIISIIWNIICQDIY